MTDTFDSRPRGKRFYENDWLTVIATIVILFFHCARYFDLEDWHVKNPMESFGMTVVTAFLSQWIMPLFFLLSGMSSGFSLTSRGTGRFLLDRFMRLGLPFLFGVLVVSIPAQVWVERVSHGDFSGSFLEFYPQYFDGWYAFGGNFAWMGLHLWYLLMLLLFSCLCAPTFALLTPQRLGQSLAGLAAMAGRTGGVFVFALPILAVEYLVNMDPEGIGMRAFGGWSPLTYLVVFLLGYLFSSEPRYREGLRRTAPLALGTALLCFIALAAGLIHRGAADDPLYPLHVLVRVLHSWSWLVALYGLGCRFLASPDRWLPWLRETALPFYIVHQSVIVVLGYYLLPLNLPVLPKYLLLLGASFTLIMLILAAIKRVRPLRPLFGLRLTTPAPFPSRAP